MKLAVKLTVALSLGILTVHLAAAGYRVYRENALFRADIGRDSRVLGRALAHASELAWETDGEAGVAALITHATARQEHTEVRWVWRGDGGAAATEPAAMRESLASNTAVTIEHSAPEHALITYVPVELAPGVVGALEITNDLTDEQDYIRNSVVAALATTTVLVSLCAVVAWLLSARLIGDPIRTLITRARGVGEGDLRNRLELSGSLEFRELANEMNRMCERLEQASERATAAAAAHAVAQEQLQHADRLATVGTLASSVAHELGTPINVIEGHAQLLRETGIGEAAAHHVSLIERQCHRMTAIIRQWLDFARRSRTGEERCYVEDVIKQTLQMLQPMARSSSVVIEVPGNGQRHCAAINPGALQQVVLNLSVNAIHAMSKGGTLKLDVSTVQRYRDEFVRIVVADTGGGVPDEFREQIFEPFYTTKEPGRGSGLGLPIARGIVQDYGGWLDLASSGASGTTFEVRLPTE